MQQADDAAAAAAPYATLFNSLAASAAMGAAYWVLRAIRFGFQVPWERMPPPSRSAGYPLPAVEALWCATEVDAWVTAGYVTRLSQAAGAGSPWVSPSFVVYGSKSRLAIDLRRINAHIKKRIFHYQRLPAFLSTLVPDDHLTSWDVKDAFYHVRINPAHRKYFRFIVNGVVYEPRVLPFGVRLSPWVWTKMMRPVVAALRLQGFRLIAYVDDCAATGRRSVPSTKADATRGRAEILKVFERLGVQVHPRKGEAVGTRQLPLLGFLVDATRQLVLLPVTRLDKLLSKTKALLSEAARRSRRINSKQLQ